jgi:hypothetical protein
MTTKPVKAKKSDKKVKEKTSVKSKKPKESSKKLIPNAILEIAKEHPDILVIDVDKHSALLIKKKVATVHEELCAGTMSPVQRIVEQTFFHTFMLQWDGKIKNIDKLEEIGFPITSVVTPAEAYYAIQEA